MSDHELTRPEFPRSNAYDPAWVMANQMGPNVLWLTEWLTGAMQLAPGMRVLDLGCGMALSSIFLAREYEVRVWAADLWVGPDGNWRRVKEAGAGDRVCPVRAEAHALPFAAGFFDAVVSVDSYQYFGSDELYLSYLTRFVRPGGQIGVVMPGLVHELPASVSGGLDVPEPLRVPQANGKRFWEDECLTFHTAETWRDVFLRSNKVDIEIADRLPDGWKLWAEFEEAIERAQRNLFPSDAEALRRDAGRTMTFVRLVTRRRSGEAAMNLYEPDLALRVRGTD